MKWDQGWLIMPGKNLLFFGTLISVSLALIFSYFSRNGSSAVSAKNLTKTPKVINIVPLNRSMISNVFSFACPSGEGIALSFDSDKNQKAKLISCFSAESPDNTQVEDGASENIISETASKDSTHSLIQAVCEYSDFQNGYNKNAIFAALHQDISRKMALPYYKKKADNTCEKMVANLQRVQDLDLKLSQGACDLGDLSTFSNLKKLKLHLDSSVFCTNISDLGKRLRLLLVKGGILKNPRFKVEKWPYLEELELIETKVSPADIAAISDLNSLRKLSVSSMKLKSIPDFSNNTQLVYLDVSWNNLETINPGFLPKALKDIKLYGNPIKVMDAFNLVFNKEFPELSVDLPKKATLLFVE